MRDIKHNLYTQDDSDDVKENPPEELETDKDDEGQIANTQSQQTEQIIQTGSITPTKGRHVIHCLTIVGQIEGHYILPPQNKTTKYEHVIPQLVAIQEDPQIQGLIVILNTVGGDVEAGLAIAELVAGMHKPTVSIVLGGGHSIGVPLAVSADTSFIVPSATMTLHPVRMNGVVLGVPQTLSYFDKMQDRIARFVTSNSKITDEKFRSLVMNTGELVMDVGTVLDGEQAVECGLIDRLGGLADAINCLYDLIDEKIAKADGDSKAKEKSEDKPASSAGSAIRVQPPARRRRTVRARRRELLREAAAVASLVSLQNKESGHVPADMPTARPVSGAWPAQMAQGHVSGVWPPHRMSGSHSRDSVLRSPVGPNAWEMIPGDSTGGPRSGPAGDAYDRWDLGQRNKDGGEVPRVNPFGDPSPIID